MPGLRRVLIVEDEAAVGRPLARFLEGLGCRVIGPAESVASAMALVEAGALDAALLDFNLGRETCVPVADLLIARNVPFALMSGAPPERLPPQLRDRPFVGKPYRLELIGAVLDSILGRAGA